jgi:hypothetical protein
LLFAIFSKVRFDVPANKRSIDIIISLSVAHQYC